MLDHFAWWRVIRMRHDSRTAAVQCLPDLAGKWTTLAEALSTVQSMGRRENSR
jgi:hypothetical protein